MSEDLENASRIQIIREEVKQLCGNCERLTEDEFKEKVLGIMAIGFSFGLNADRPQGYWTKTDVATYRCSECGKIQIADDDNELNYCCCCGSRNKVRRLKGADDE